MWRRINNTPIQLTGAKMPTKTKSTAAACPGAGIYMGLGIFLFWGGTTWGTSVYVTTCMYTRKMITAKTMFVRFSWGGDKLHKVEVQLRPEVLWLRAWLEFTATIRGAGDIGEGQLLTYVAMHIINDSC